MNIEKKLVRIRDVLTETQRCNINTLFRRYGLEFTKKIFTIKRCDTRKIQKSCSCISLWDIDNLLKKVEVEFQKSKNMNTKMSIATVRTIRKDVESFLNINNQKRQNEHINS